MASFAETDLGHGGEPGASAGSVFVKRSGDESARFARVPILVGDAVTDLAKRAALELEWRTTASYVGLFLVKPAGEEPAFATPTQAQIDAVLNNEGKVLGEGVPLSLAGITSGAWVVARLNAPAAAHGECARSREAHCRSLLLRSSSRGAVAPRGVRAIPPGELTLFAPSFPHRWWRRRRRRKPRTW